MTSRSDLHPLPAEQPEPIPKPEPPKFKVGDRFRWKRDANVAEWLRGTEGVVHKIRDDKLIVETYGDHRIITTEDAIEPLPQWTPTDERISLQKFTNGTDSEWRIV